MPLDLSCGETEWYESGGVDQWSVAPDLHVHFWLKRTDAPGATYSIVKKTPAAGPVNGWGIRLSATHIYFDLWTNDGSACAISYAWAPDAGDWHCIDATFDGRYCYLYIDDDQVGSHDFGEARALALEAATSMLLSATPNYPGDIEGLAIWSAAQSAAQRAILYNGGRRIALAEIRLMASGWLEALLELRHDTIDYSAFDRDIDLSTSLTDECGRPSRTLGQGGGYGFAYCPPVREVPDRCCTHTDLAETIGH